MGSSHVARCERGPFEHAVAGAHVVHSIARSGRTARARRARRGAAFVETPLVHPVSVLRTSPATSAYPSRRRGSSPSEVGIGVVRRATACATPTSPAWSDHRWLPRCNDPDGLFVGRKERTRDPHSATPRRSCGALVRGAVRCDRPEGWTPLRATVHRRRWVAADRDEAEKAEAYRARPSSDAVGPETFGHTYLEAGTRGPVIAGDIPALREIVRTDRWLVVHSSRTRSRARSSPPRDTLRARRMGESGRSGFRKSGRGSRRRRTSARTRRRATSRYR